MRERERQRDAVNRQYGEVLADQNLEIGGRQREEQFVRPQFLLIGPSAHRDGRNQEEQQHGKAVAQLVQVGHVVREKLRPKCQQAARHHEGDNEQVAQHARKIAGDVAAKDGARSRTCETQSRLLVGRMGSQCERWVA